MRTSALALALLLVACGSLSDHRTLGPSVLISPSPPAETTPVPSPTESPVVSPIRPPTTPSSPAPVTPAGQPPIPLQPGPMAADLVRTDRTARAAVRGWVARGGPSRFPVPPSVVGPVLREQLLSRALGERPGLVGPVIARLPAGLAGRVRDEAMAERDLFALAARSTFKPVPIVTQSPQPAAELLGDFRFAERRFGVPWHVLAAVMFVESKFGRIRSVSPAGAQGPMQFIPATWKAYGLGGDVNDPHDAVLGAANYLHARGAPADLRRALFAYNPAPLYGDAVLLFANQMERDPLAYYVLYNWQVFVHGRPATGP